VRKLSDDFFVGEHALITIGSLRSSTFKVDDRQLKALVDNNLYKQAEAIVYRVGHEVRDKARAAAPKDTGALAASVYVTAPGARPENTGQRTAGYWRAINAASRKSGGRLEPVTDSEFVSNVRTQARKGSFKVPAMTSKGAGLVDVGSMSTTGEAIDQDLNPTNLYDFMPMAVVGKDRFFVAIGVAVFYAGYVEYGTVHKPARPFFTPAVMWGSREVARRITELLNGFGRHS
jgi:HK97 gp10 family phage protein